MRIASDMVVDFLSLFLLYCLRTSSHSRPANITQATGKFEGGNGTILVSKTSSEAVGKSIFLDGLRMVESLTRF